MHDLFDESESELDQKYLDELLNYIENNYQAKNETVDFR
jgi:energy-coupling factor transporter ATP-binding protein EcfA2